VIATVNHSQALWYLTRGTGLVTLVLLTASVVLGILQVKRWSSERWPRFVTAGLHKNISLLSVVFLAVHIGSTVVDGFAPIGWLDAVVPFRSPYRPLWLGLGAVAVDLLLALVVTSLLRGRIGYRAWKAVHWAAYACWPVAVLHGMGTGTDTKLGVVLLLNAVCLGAVALAVWWRLADLATGRIAHSGAAVAAGIAGVVVPVAIVAFLLAGPLQPGWSQRAGTPRASTAVAAGTAAPAAVVAPASAAATTRPGPVDATLFAGTFDDTLAGTLVQSADGTSVTIDGALAGSVPGHLRVVLDGQPSGGGGIVMTASSAALGPSADPAYYQGSVRSLAGDRLGLALTAPDGRRIGVVVQLNLDGSTNVTGTVTGGQQTASGVRGDD